jgi:cobalt-zinc-cadmium efflux system membrane fusion protein
MTRSIFIPSAIVLVSCFFLANCGNSAHADTDPKGGAPPAANVERESNDGLIHVDHPDQFPLITAGERVHASTLDVTGSVNPDTSLNIPVISLASGRVVDIHARIGDTVTKGQLLMRVQSADISQAFSEYRQAVADEKLSAAQLSRAQVLYEKGAIAQKDLEVADDTDAKAKVTVETTTEHLRVLGADMTHPSSLVDIYAPVAGVITEQNVTASSGVKTLDNSPNLFTIADVTHVWIVCDVYENDLPFIHLGEYADIHLTAYPNRVFKGRISNIGPTLDPTIRTAKVRLEVENPGMLRFGMFVTATFHGTDSHKNATVPADAVLHLHDRDWVYVPEGSGFRRVAVNAGDMLPDKMQEILSGVNPGQKVIARALIFQNTAEQ